jgi:hypothetical protein
MRTNLCEYLPLDRFYSFVHLHYTTITILPIEGAELKCSQYSGVQLFIGDLMGKAMLGSTNAFSQRGAQ